MSDYTLLEAALQLGGMVRQVERVEQSCPDPEPIGGGSGGCSRYDGHSSSGCLTTPSGGSSVGSLSSPHISPHVKFFTGSSLLKASRGGASGLVGGGLRGAVQGFSADARRRLMLTIGSIRRDAALPLFITLTYPNAFPDPSGSKKHLDIFFKRFNRAFPGHGSIWKLEPQERGAPHYHILTWNCDLEKIRSWLPLEWFQIAGSGDRRHLLWHEGKAGNGNVHCVQAVRSWKGVWSYASKYLGKTFDVAGWSDKWTGRFWGVIHRPLIPFGDLVQLEVTHKKAVEILRYEKRFSGLKHCHKSLTIFCDADQWIEKIGLLES